MDYILMTTFTGVIAALYALFWYLLHGYRRNCNSKVLLHGKTVIVTGGNAGLGKATAMDLARRGARVILACRNPKRAEEAVKDIQKCSNNTNVMYRHLDLASLESVRRFANEYLEEEQRLDILVNNGGVALGFVLKKPRKYTVDGFELNFGTNYFGHFLLTLLLLGRLKQCLPSRIVMLTSDMHERVQSALDFTPRSTDGSRYPGLCGYPISKAAIIMFARELGSRLKQTGVSVCSVHPGWVYTNVMAREFDDFSSQDFYRRLHYFLRPFFWLFLQSEVAGAQSVIHCAVDESIADHSGSFYANYQMSPVRSWVARDEVMRQRLWQISCEAVGIKDGNARSRNNVSDYVNNNSSDFSSD